MISFINNPIILIDGSSYLYRAYYKYPILINEINENIGVIYGFLKMLRNLIKKYKSNNIAIIFDSKGSNFRHIIFNEYKSNRKPMPQELQIQIKPLFKILQNILGISIFSIPGVEGDDVIGTLAIELEKNGKQVLISTNDKDIAQLVTPNILMFDNITNYVYGPEEIKQKYGISPLFFKDYLALVGDKADNIPGVLGIGKKTATFLIQKLGNINSIYNNLDKISSFSFRGSKNVSKKLQINKNIAFMCYKLVTIKTDIKINKNFNNLNFDLNNLKLLDSLCNKYILKKNILDIKKNNLLFINSKNYNNTSINEIYEKSPNKYITILNKDDFNHLVIKLNNANLFAFEIITNSLNILNFTIIGISLSIIKNYDYESFYLPINHNYINNPKQLDLTFVLQRLKPILENKNLYKISYNVKLYNNFLKKYNINLSGIKFDVMLESYVLDSNSGKQSKFNIYKKWLNYDFKLLEHIIKESNNFIDFNKIKINKATYFAVENINLIIRLHLIIWPKLKKILELKKIFQEIEMPLLYIISQMELNGVLIDQKILFDYSNNLSIKLQNIENTIYKLAGYSFNINSTKQLQILLFKKQKNTPILKTKAGNYSTNEDVLIKLSVKNELPKKILEYRNLFKLKNTYVDKLLKMINPFTKRIHTSYNQTVTITGRLSSTNPNLQNIPIRHKQGNKIRQAFIASNNFILLSADYSQIELRIMAHLSNDLRLVQAFIQDNDIHTFTASNIFGVTLKNVSSEQRYIAKNINFSLIYGMSAFGLSRKLNIDISDAKLYIKNYFEYYSGIKSYIENIIKYARNKKYVKTLYGRYIFLPNIISNKKSLRNYSERIAINAPLQGTSADIIKISMISINNWIQKNFPNKIKIIMQIHDELIFEIKEDIINIAVVKIKQLMENIKHLNIPLKVNIDIRSNLYKNNFL